jgi:hypothetical protein
MGSMAFRLTGVEFAERLPITMTSLFMIHFERSILLANCSCCDFDRCPLIGRTLYKKGGRYEGRSRLLWRRHVRTPSVRSMSQSATGRIVYERRI